MPAKVKQSPHSLSRVIFQRQFVTVLQVTPALVRQLPESVITSRLLGPESCVRVLAFGGEACPSMETLTQWKSPQVQIQMYCIAGNLGEFGEDKNSPIYINACTPTCTCMLLSIQITKEPFRQTQCLPKLCTIILAKFEFSPKL